MREQKPGIFELLKLQFIWRPFVAGLRQAINDGLPAALNRPGIAGGYFV
jgi:hypothetical protein